MTSKSLILTIVFYCLLSPLMAANNGLPIQSTNPIQDKDAATLLDIDFNKNTKNREMRVLVFPHTLKNDYRHGIPDDDSKVRFESTEKIELSNDTGLRLSSKTIDIVVNGTDMVVTLEDGTLISVASKINLIGKASIKVIRSLNLDKSHSYLGSFEILLKQKAMKVINNVSIETYLRGVVPSESIHTWPLASLKAQAVAARTYALYHNKSFEKKEWDVDDTARFQVYTGLTHVQNSTDKAIKETANQVMTYNGKLIVAYFHSYSGGRTDSALNIFNQTSAPYCLGKEEVFTREELLQELQAGAHWIVNWSTELYSPENLLAIFKENSSTRGGFKSFVQGEGLKLNVVADNVMFDSHKTFEAVQNQHNTKLEFTKIRKSIGWSKFPSYHFKISDENGKYLFKGHGWGHHVGMSQWGAFMMAKKYNKTYQEILNHYYSGITIKEL
jgi:stage II sporulation protein D